MTFRDHLDGGGRLLLDGGLGSALMARGLQRGAPPELWNLERGDVITEVHRGYVEAGSDAIQTNTFGGNPVRLRAYGLEDRCEEINRAAVEHARAANPRFVIGDVGPTGEYLPPVGQGSIEAWRKAFERQARALAAADVDAIHVETMSDIREARTALEAVLAEARGVPVIVSMTFEKKKRGFFTVMGDRLVDSLNTLAEAGAIAVGANCSIESKEMRELVDEALPGVTARLVIQPNAGAPELASDGTFRYAQSPEEFAEDMIAIDARGVSILGGCCGTDARFIGALRVRSKERKREA